MAEQTSKLKAVSHFLLDSGLNMALRGLTLASKFFLLIFLAKTLPPEELGVYGLFTVTIGYSLFLLGLDFYTYAHRELLSSARQEWWGIIRTQFTFYMVVYLVMLPALLVVFVAGWVPWKLAGWFYLLVTLEHLSQELYRLLILDSKVTMANLVLFLRSGSWAFAVVALFWLKPELQGLTFLWVGWSIGGGLSVFLALFGLRSLMNCGQQNFRMDWAWVVRGLHVAGCFLIGTLALRALFAFDRYFVDMYAGKAIVGVYSFYVGVAGALLAFADAGVVARFYPSIVASYRVGKFDEYRKQLRKLAFGTLAVSAVFSLAVWITLKPVLMFVGRDIYLDHVSVLWWLVLAMSIYCVGLVPHYALYAKGNDRGILIANIFSLTIFLVASRLFAPSHGANGIAFSVVIAFVGLSLFKIGLLSIYE